MRDRVSPIRVFHQNDQFRFFAFEIRHAGILEAPTTWYHQKTDAEGEDFLGGKGEEKAKRKQSQRQKHR